MFLDWLLKDAILKGNAIWTAQHEAASFAASCLQLIPTARRAVGDLFLFLCRAPRLHVALHVNREDSIDSAGLRTQIRITRKSRMFATFEVLLTCHFYRLLPGRETALKLVTGSRPSLDDLSFKRWKFLKSETLNFFNYYFC